MSVETELKFALPPRRAARVMGQAAIERLAAGPPSSERLLSVYYDTPDFALRDAGIALRLRRTATGWVQTAKWGGEVLGGLHRRHELEMPVPQQSLAFDLLTEPALAAVLAHARLRRRIGSVFVTDFKRTARLLSWPDGTRAELSLDRGRIIAGHAEAPICELELELKAGTVARLFELAIELEAVLGLRPEARSKSERGYALAGAGTAPARARAVALERTLTIPESAARILASGLEQIQANEHGMLQGSDPEYLHQMRVAVRRLRSCLGMYAHALPSQTIDTLRAELAWLGRRLGPARDWDVFLTETLPDLEAGLDGCADTQGLRARARALREAAQRSAISAVRTRRYARLLLALGGAAAGTAWGVAEDAARAPLLPFAGRLLDRRLERVRARGGKKAAGSIEELHALRIAVKKLRYAAEFFAGLYPGGRPRAYREQLGRLQDGLGAINDASTTRVLVARLAGARTHLSAVVLGWNAHVVHAERARLRGLWREFRRMRKFW